MLPHSGEKVRMGSQKEHYKNALNSNTKQKCTPSAACDRTKLKENPRSKQKANQQTLITCTVYYFVLISLISSRMIYFYFLVFRVADLRNMLYEWYNGRHPSVT